MRNFTPWALSALLSLSLATPIEQRDVGDKTITVIDEVIVTVDVTKILYGKPPGPTPKQDKHVAYHAKAGGGHAHHAVHAAPKSSSPVPVVKPVEKVVVPATPPTSTTAPDQKTPDEIQAEINSKQIQINDEQKSKDIAHQNEMIALQNGGHQPTQQVAPPVQQPTPAAPVATPKKAVPAPENPTPATGGSSSSSSSGGGGSCGSIGGDCSGDVTIYNDQGAGACGWTNDTNSDDFFALAARKSCLTIILTSYLTFLFYSAILSLSLSYRS